MNKCQLLTKAAFLCFTDIYKLDKQQIKNFQLQPLVLQTKQTFNMWTAVMASSLSLPEGTWHGSLQEGQLLQ